MTRWVNRHRVKIVVVMVAVAVAFVTAYWLIGSTAQCMAGPVVTFVLMGLLLLDLSWLRWRRR